MGHHFESITYLGVFLGIPYTLTMVMTLQVGKGSNLKAPMEIDSAHAEYPANGARLYTVKSNSERYHFLYRK